MVSRSSWRITLAGIVFAELGCGYFCRKVRPVFPKDGIASQVIGLIDRVGLFRLCV
jgi:hypothetical protein